MCYTIILVNFEFLISDNVRFEIENKSFRLTLRLRKENLSKMSGVFCRARRKWHHDTKKQRPSKLWTQPNNSYLECRLTEKHYNKNIEQDGLNNISTTDRW